MDPRFPPLLSQRQCDARPVARTLPLPSLPLGEWLIAAVALALLIAL